MDRTQIMYICLKNVLDAFWAGQYLPGQALDPEPIYCVGPGEEKVAEQFAQVVRAVAQAMIDIAALAGEADADEYDGLCDEYDDETFEDGDDDELPF